MSKENKPRKTHLKEGSRSAELFKEIVDSLDLVLTFGYQPCAVLKYGMDGIYRMRSAQERADQRRAINGLKKKKLLEIEQRADKYFVALTQKGANEYLRLKVLSSDLYEDDRECLVVFDVPESRRDIRKLLREFLWNAGFIPIQKSVWISQFNAGEALSTLLNAIGLKKWVRIYEVREYDHVE
jgi:CRISPR-associated endonuclease Cas2